MADPADSPVALIVRGGPGVGASCARRFAREGMTVAVAACTPDKPALVDLEREHGVKRYACDAADPVSVARLFEDESRDLGPPRLVIHNIDGRTSDMSRKSMTKADPELVR